LLEKLMRLGCEDWSLITRQRGNDTKLNKTEGDKQK
jgi:hypothetical protein